MPIYEYVCQNCKAEFEAIRPISEKDKKIKCEKCGSKKTKRKLALAAKSFSHALPMASGGGASASRCGSCGGGNCASCGG